MQAVHSGLPSTLTLCLLTAMLSGSAALSGAEANQQVRVFLGPETTRHLTTYAGHERQILHEREARLDTGAQTFGVRYVAGYDPAIADRVFPLEGSIGMDAPSLCNWYHSGFLWVFLDGEDAGTAPLSSMNVSEMGDRGIVDMVWHHPKATVRVRFVAYPGKDALYAEIAIEPTVPLTRSEVRMRCYPCYFTTHNKRVGARRIQTPNGLVKEGENQVLPAAQHTWALYYDEVFDVAKGEGEGPCALAFAPDGVQTIQHVPGGYAVDTTLSLAPETRVLRVAFWDFRGRTNSDALARLTEAAADTLADMKALDFTPQAIRSFDPLALRTLLERTASIASLEPALKERVRTALAHLQNGTNDETGQDSRSIARQESVLLALSTYETLVWDIKLADLLNGL